MPDGEEQSLVEQLVAYATVKALDEPFWVGLLGAMCTSGETPFG